jgi:hypothetical protein
LSKLPHLFCPSDEDIRGIHNSPERQNRFHIVKYSWGQPGRGNKDNEVLGGWFMNGKTIVGIALIVLGALALAYHGFSYTTREKAVDIGSLQVTKEEHHDVVPVPPLLGAIALAGGVAVLVVGRRAK